jgi:hypothetical protein
MWKLDGGTVDDGTGFVLLGREPSDRSVYSHIRALIFVHSNAISHGSIHRKRVRTRHHQSIEIVREAVENPERIPFVQ